LSAKPRKLKSLAELRKIVAAKRAEGKSIVLANGCFDLIHGGHIRYLQGAKAEGDILVVAANSDASVRRLKGRGRPILRQAERVEILSSFWFVDYITIFGGLRVTRILLALKPDVHAKGSDYTKDTVPEREVVKAYGGEVAIVGGPKIRNTSEILKSLISR
jgi:rfaE bifunctional protein nucleotidyltransferase chain/domain